MNLLCSNIMKFIEHKIYKSTGEFEGKIINEVWIMKIFGFEIVLKEKVHWLI